LETPVTGEESAALASPLNKSGCQSEGRAPSTFEVIVNRLRRLMLVLASILCTLAVMPEVIQFALDHWRYY